MPEKFFEEFWIECEREQEATLNVSKLEWYDCISLLDLVRIRAAMFWISWRRWIWKSSGNEFITYYW